VAPGPARGEVDPLAIPRPCCLILALVLGWMAESPRRAALGVDQIELSGALAAGGGQDRAAVGGPAGGGCYFHSHGRELSRAGAVRVCEPDLLASRAGRHERDAVAFRRVVRGVVHAGRGDQALGSGDGRAGPSQLDTVDVRVVSPVAEDETARFG